MPQDAAQIEAAFAALRAQVGTPQRLDLPVIATRDAKWSHRGRLALRLTSEAGAPLGRAYVFGGEWYPGSDRSTSFSHYLPTLERAFAGLAQGGRPERLRLQLLKAVAAETSTGGTIIVPLKFIIAPEWTLTGGQLETVYGCPLAAFYTGFVGIDRDPTRDATAPTFTVGNAIHAGYRAAATARVGGDDADAIGAAYIEAVARTWATDFAHLLLDRPSGRPKAIHRRPLDARDLILERLDETIPPAGDPRALLQERLFFAPGRGVSGRADRLVYRPATATGEMGAVETLHEVKTGGGFGAEKDPLTGIARPGGLQALAYREIVRALGGGEAETFIEAIEDDEATEVPLDDHPIVRRARARLADGGNDRATDLLAQSRNVGFLLMSGLLTGYDRHRIDTIAGLGRRVREVGGDWALHATNTPCQICPASARGICEAAQGHGRAPVANFFRHLPQELYAYWVWFHRQLGDEDRTGREALHHLATTAQGVLEGQEGVSIGALTPQTGGGVRTVRFARRDRIETRLREDDRVLVTPADHAPGELLSVEGTLSTVGSNTVAAELRDTLPPSASGRYRVDALPFHSPWQRQGLTDFLLGASRGATASGRQLRVTELPHLAQLLLGAAEPAPLAAPATTDEAPGLNADQRRALGAALALAPGELMLLQGPPGTGKTSTIATLAHAIARRDFFAASDKPTRRPLLILANTHRAADEVTAKIAERFPELRPYLVRVGVARGATEPTVRAQILGERLGVREALVGLDLTTTDGLERWVRLIRAGVTIHDHAQLFVGTLAAANAPELRGLTFGTVIVDECGQATEPAALQALRHLPERYTGRLILVGDHQQLPPVVPEVSDAIPLSEMPESLVGAGFTGGEGLRVSLFERLARRYPAALITLAAQYRMNAPICAIISDLFYNGALHPGTAAVADSRLAAFLEHLGTAPAPQGDDWDDTPILFLDTSADPAARDTVRRWRASESRDNPREAAIVAELVVALFRRTPRAAWEALAAEVGIISAYRKQNNRLRQEIAAREPGLAALRALRIDTVDRFQGGERQILFVSLVNANAEHAIGTLHADPRRLNVALSRARTKLIVVGDRATFTGPGHPEEEAAKADYRRLFALLDEQAMHGTARLADTAAR